jgi:hypothetical protein
MKWVPFMKHVVLWVYYWIWGHREKEPWCVLKCMAEQPFSNMLSIIDHAMVRPNWFETIRNVRRGGRTAYRRIQIVSGKNDRYNAFARCLADTHPDLFKLSEIDDSAHHTLYFDFVEVANLLY